MTTLAVEIDGDNDLSTLKALINKLGLKYRVEQNVGVLYTDEIKSELDKRYAAYRHGMEMVSSEESQQKIQSLLSAHGN